MKKVCFFSLVCMIMSIFGFSSMTFAYEGCSEPESQSVKRGSMVSSKYLCSEDILFGPESESLLPNGQKVYSKNISIKKDFKKVSNNDFESKGDLGLDLTFTYDKKSYAHVQNSDLKSVKNSKSWKIRNLAEIHPDGEACLVSNRYAAYKKSALGLGKYVLDGHIDVHCSKCGDIFVNTELS